MRRLLALLGLLLLAAPAHADDMALGVSAPGHAAPEVCAIPALATNNSFTLNSFCSTWQSYSKVDVANSQAAGFNWYVTNNFPVASGWWLTASFSGREPFPTPFDTYANITSGTMLLTQTAAENSALTQLTSCTWNGSAIVGNTFTGGALVDYYASYNASSGSLTTGWSATWATAAEFLSGALQTTASASAPAGHDIDISFFEAYPSGGSDNIGSAQMLNAAQDEFNPPMSGINKNIYDVAPTIAAHFPGFNYQVMHHYQFLWVPIALGNGTGSMSWYVDGFQTESMTYSATGTPNPAPNSGSTFAGQLSQMDAQHLCLIIDPGSSGNPMTIGQYAVWQPGMVMTAPATANVTASNATAISGLNLIDNYNPSRATVTITSANGVLTGTGAGAIGSGTNTLILSAAVTSINTALATITENTPVNDTITIAVTDTSGHSVPNKTIAVTASAAGGATLDPSNTNAAITLSNGNLTATSNQTAGSGTYGITRSIQSQTSGQYYFEATAAGGSVPYDFSVGILNASAANGGYNNLGADGNAIAWIGSVTALTTNNTNVGTTPTYAAGSTIGIAIDLTAKLMWVRNISAPGTWNAGGGCTPANAACGISFSAVSGPYYAGATLRDDGTASDKLTFNFGGSAFAATAPSGFTGWGGSNGGTAAARAQSFVNAFGANVHMYYGGGYTTANAIADLSYAGIKTVRDCGFNVENTPTNAYDTLAAAGISFDFDVCSGPNSQLPGDISAYALLASTWPNSIVAIEGPNEINNFPVTYSGTANVSNTTLAGNTVLTFSAVPPPVVAAANSGWGSFTSLGGGVTLSGTGIAGGATVVSATSTTVTMSAPATSGGVISGTTVTFTASGSNQTIGWAAAGAAFQKDLYGQSKANSTLANLPVVNLTTCCTPYGYAGSADINNGHFYQSFGYPPLQSLPTAMAENLPTTLTGLPVWVTETGFYTTPTNDGTGLNQTTAAQYQTEEFFDLWAFGITRWFVYELIDESSSPLWGLFAASGNGSGAAKTSGLAIHNLTTIMGDIGSSALSFTPGSFNYSITNLPAATTQPGSNGSNYGGHSLLFQKSNGTFEIPIWYEQVLWNTSTFAPIAPATASITVNLPASYNVNVYDLITGGTTPVNSYTGVTSVTLTLGGDPVIVEVLPGPVVVAGGTISYTAGAAAQILDGTVTVTDPGVTNLSSASISITSGFFAGDVLNFSTQNGITGSYNSSTGALALSGSSTVANYQTALRSITYDSSAGDPTHGGANPTRTVTWTVTE